MVEAAGAKVVSENDPATQIKTLSSWDASAPLNESFTAAEFAAVAAESEDDEVILRAARFVFGGGVPTRHIRTWATHLLCCRATKENGAAESPFALLAKLAASSQRACGHVFALGDIAWNCRTCQKDNTCVLCDACFRLSNHEGHEVFFHRAAPGGCCDCGDAEAWVAEGCCARHRPSASGVEDEDPVAQLPASLARAGAAVARAAALEIVQAVVACGASHESADRNAALAHAPRPPDPGAAEAFLNAALLDAPASLAGALDGDEASRASLLEGLARAARDRFAAPAPASNPDDDVQVRLHNDDVHTYDDVIDALQSLGVSATAARGIASDVDRDGDAVLPPTQLSTKAVLKTLHAKGLLGAAISPAHVALEKRAVVLAKWLSELVRGSDALRRLVAVEFARPLAALGCDAPPLLGSERFGLRERVVDGRRRLVLEDADDGVFDDDRRAKPSSPPFASTPFGVLVATDALLPKTLRLAAHDVLLRALVDGVARAALADALLGAYGSVSRLFGQGVGTADDTIFALSVQIFTTPSLVRKALAPVREADAGDLKHGGVLSVVLRALLGSLGAAGCDARRERKREAEHKRPSRRRPRDAPADPTTPLLADHQRRAAALAATDAEDDAREAVLQRWALEDDGAVAPPPRRSAADGFDADAFLEHAVVHHRRFAHALRDFEYALQTEGVATEMLRGGRDAGVAPGGAPLVAWLALLSRLHGIDEFTRRDRSSPHVEYESRRWVLAFNLALNVASASELLVARALEGPGGPPPADGRSAALGAHWAAVAALLEWLAARVGTHEWRRVGATSDAASRVAALDGAGGGGDMLLFDVCSQPVSLHLPLHRFVAVVALRAAAVGFDPLPALATARGRDRRRVLRAARVLDDLSDDDEAKAPIQPLGKTLGATEVGELLRPRCEPCDDEAAPDDGDALARDALGRALVDHPLRALAYCSHVNANLWRRNGHSALSTALSYASPPLCHSLRDVDVAAVQLGCLCLGADAVVLTALRRFCVDRYLLDASADARDAARTSAGAVAAHETANARAFAVAVIAGAIASALRTTPSPRARDAVAAAADDDEEEDEEEEEEEEEDDDDEATVDEEERGANPPVTEATPPPPVDAAPAAPDAAPSLDERRQMRRLAAAAAIANAAAADDAAPPATTTVAPFAIATARPRRAAFRVARAAPGAEPPTPTTPPPVRPFGALPGDDDGDPAERRAPRRAAAAPSTPPPSMLAPAASDVVALVCRLATDMPPPPGAVHLEAKCLRELVHALAVAPQRHSELVTIVSAAAKAFGGAVVAGGGASRKAPLVPIDALLSNAAFRSTDGESAPHRDARSSVWELNPDRCVDYDPNFPRLSKADHERAAERILGLRRKALGAKRDPQPLVRAPPECHAAFAGARDALLRCEAAHRALQGALVRGDGESGRETTDNAGERELECKAVHLATLVAHDARLSGRSLERWRGAGGVMSLLLKLRGRGPSPLGAPIYDEGLVWLLAEAAELDGGCAALKAAADADVAEAAAALAAATPDGDRDAKLRKRKEKARQKALARIKKQQAKFAASLEEEKAENHDAATPSPDARGRSSSFEAAAAPDAPPPLVLDEARTIDEDRPTCIMCRNGAEASNPLGLVALAQRSCVVARSVDRGRRGPRRWLATRRVEATESPGPASSGRRPLKVYEAGDEVHVAHVRGDYAKLLLPQGGVGWAAIRGPPAPRVPGRLVADDDALVPLDEAAWRRWGRCRVHVMTCGHHVHFGCWDAYFASVLQKALAGENFDGRFCVDVSRREFLCPLCKGLANCLVPAYDDDDEATRPATPRDSAVEAAAAWARAGGVLGCGDAPAAESEAHATRRFADSLADVADGGSAPPALPPVAAALAAWTAAAYTATASSRCAVGDAGKAALLGATASLRALRRCPLSGDARVEVEARLSSLLRGEIPASGENKALPPGLAHPTLAVVRPDGASAAGWRGDGAAKNRADAAFDQPLLAWDLSVLLVAIATLWPKRDAALAGDALVLARLAQFLLEPEPEPSSREESFDGEDAEDREALEALDALVRRNAKLPPRTRRLAVADVLRAVDPFAKTADLILGAAADGAATTPLDLAGASKSAGTVLLLEAWAASYGAAYAGADHRPPPLAIGSLTPDDDFLDDAPESARDLFDEAPDEHGDEGAVDGSTTTVTRHVTGDASGANREPGAFPPTPLLASLSGHGAPDALGNAHDVADVSHFGLPRPGLPGDVAFRFVRLPESFTELYAKLRDARGLAPRPGEGARGASGDDVDPAVCLLTGRVLNAGAKRAPGVPGNCTVHARRVNGDGVGVYFLVLKCAVLLVRGPHASYAPSIYVDDHGEEDVGLRRGAPLRLNHDRLRALELLYNNHGVAREVARLRAKSNRVIRDSYY